MLVRILVVISSLVLMQAADAQSRSKLLDATDPQKIARTIQDLGYRARLEVEADTTTAIYSSIGGTDFAIQFLSCDDGYDECKVLLFKVGYNLTDGTTLETVESFNEQTIIGRAYLDDENDPWLEFAVNLYGGVTRTNFEDTFDWWEVIITEFETHIGF